MAYLLGFNNNIRCIEIDFSDYAELDERMFNNNIRCIEMLASYNLVTLHVRLITT